MIRAPRGAAVVITAQMGTTVQPVLRTENVAGAELMKPDGGGRVDQRSAYFTGRFDIIWAFFGGGCGGLVGDVSR